MKARSVIDYIAWIEHCAWVQSICDTPTTVMAVFKSFKRSASAERGRMLNDPSWILRDP